MRGEGGASRFVPPTVLGLLGGEGSWMAGYQGALPGVGADDVGGWRTNDPSGSEGCCHLRVWSSAGTFDSVRAPWQISLRRSRGGREAGSIVGSRGRGCAWVGWFFGSSPLLSPDNFSWLRVRQSAACPTVRLFGGGRLVGRGLGCRGRAMSRVVSDRRRVRALDMQAAVRPTPKGPSRGPRCRVSQSGRVH